MALRFKSMLSAIAGMATAAALANPATAQESSLTGAWKFLCCHGASRLTVHLVQKSDAVSGDFGGGDVLRGTIDGDTVHFTRTGSDGTERHYTLAVRGFGGVLLGSFEADGAERSADNDVRMVR